MKVSTIAIFNLPISRHAAVVDRRVRSYRNFQTKRYFNIKRLCQTFETLQDGVVSDSSDWYDDSNIEDDTPASIVVRLIEGRCCAYPPYGVAV